MPCYHPIKGWASKSNVGGFTTSRQQAFIDLPRTVPCGQCSGCRLERSRQWAVRCYHEASLYENNSFITLTYNKEHLPLDRSLVIRDLQLFMKRLRKKYVPINPHKKGSVQYKQHQIQYAIRYYACGEYGDKNQRPHYHACLFNHDWKDKTVWKENNGNLIYRSMALEKLWANPTTQKSIGYSSSAEVTFESAAYVARYIMKKRLGKNTDDHYVFIDDDGVIHQRLPEFTLMSRRPGIGARWLQEFATDVYPDDFVVINGKKARPPRFYDQNHAIVSPEAMAIIKYERKEKNRKNADDNTPERLAVREKVELAKTAMFSPRNLE